MDKVSFYKEKIYEDAFEKQAKGWLRNTGISIAQDFITAGNPLNPGSHIFGSAMDGVAFEALDRKTAKLESQNKKNTETQRNTLKQQTEKKNNKQGGTFSATPNKVV